MGDSSTTDPTAPAAERVAPAADEPVVAVDGVEAVSTTEAAKAVAVPRDRFDPGPVAAAAPHPQAALPPVARAATGDPIQTKLRDVWGTIFPDDKDGLERTMRVFDALIRERMSQTGKERKDIVVVVAEHEGHIIKVVPLLKLGVTVVAYEKKTKGENFNTKLVEALDMAGFDHSNLVCRTDKSRDIPLGDIAVWNYPLFVGVPDDEGRAIMASRLLPDGILVLQTERREGLADPHLQDPRWNPLLIDRTIGAANHLMSSRYFGPSLATLLIAQRVPRYDVDELEEARQLVSSDDYSPEKLLAILKKQPALVDLWPVVVVSEGFTLEQHTLLVLKQFERYLAKRDFPPEFDRGFWRVFLALHDIGKPLAIQSGDRTKEAEHGHTSRILKEILTLMGYSERQVHLALCLTQTRFGQLIHASMISGKLEWAVEKRREDWVDFLRRGVFFKLGLSKEESERAWKQIVEEKSDKFLVGRVTENVLADLRHWSGVLSLSPSELLEHIQIYYMADAGAYTTDANDGIPQLPKEGESALDGVFVFDREERSMRFAEPYASRVRELEESVALADAALSMPVAAHGVPPSSATRTGEATTATEGSLALKLAVVETPASADEGTNRRGGNDGEPSAALKMRLMAVSTQMALGSVTLQLARMSDPDLARVVRGGRELAKRLLIRRGQGDSASVVDRLRLTDTVFLSLALIAGSDTEISRIIGAANSRSGTGATSVLSLPVAAPSILARPFSVLHVLH